MTYGRFLSRDRIFPKKPDLVTGKLSSILFDPKIPILRQKLHPYKLNSLIMALRDLVECLENKISSQREWK